MPRNPEEIRSEMVELKERNQAILAQAETQQRDLSPDETQEFDDNSSRFDANEAEVGRLEALERQRTVLATPQPRRIPPNSVARQLRTTDGTMGWRSAGEYILAVRAASIPGTHRQVDPRLMAAAPPNYGSSTDADGGYAIPPDFREGIVQLLMSEDSLLPRTDNYRTISNAISFPIDATGVWSATGGIQAYWEAEAAQKQTSKPLLDLVTVRLNKIIVLVPCTDELLEDAPVMDTYIREKAPQVINYRVNEAIIKGSGTGQPLGILNSPARITVPRTGSPVNAADLMAMYTAMPAANRATAVWIMNQDAETALFSMSFGSGTGAYVPIFMPPGGLSSAPYSTILGRPIVYSEAVNALGTEGDIIFADLKSYVTALKTGGLKTDVSIHLWFDYDITAYRFVLRIGGRPWWNGQVTTPSGTKRAPFVTLAAHAAGLGAKKQPGA